MTVPLLDRDLLVVRQKAKVIELTNQYRLQDADGADVGVIEEVGQSKGRKVLRALTKFDQVMTHRLVVRDADGSEVLQITRPRAFVRSTVEVADATGALVGRIAQENLIGKIRFALSDADGAPLGALRAENWRAWDFQIVDPGEREVARITKKWGGVLREGFTTADTYVFTIEADVQGPLRVLCFAAAAAVDTALKQNDH
jgi:uncharacterized protein YxjI